MLKQSAGKNEPRVAIQQKVFIMFLAGFEPATFRVLGGYDNHYTKETTLLEMPQKCIDLISTCLMLKQQLASKLDPAAAF